MNSGDQNTDFLTPVSRNQNQGLNSKMSSRWMGFRYLRSGTVFSVTR